MTVSWTRGNGSSVLVVVKQGSPVSADPVCGTAYTANSAFGSGTQIGASNYVVYNGTGSSINITALTPGVNYYIAIYEYNSADNCYKTPALTGICSSLSTPNFSVSPSNFNFNYVLYGSSSAFQQLNITGNNLTNAPGNINVAMPTGFKVSLSADSGYSSSVNVSYSGQTLSSTPVYIKFIPTSANTLYSSNVTISGDGTTYNNVLLTGTSLLSYNSTNLYYLGCYYYDYFINFSFNTITQTNLTCTSGYIGYNDYTSISTAFLPGKSYPISGTVESYPEYLRIWIDFNDNGIFEDPSELIYVSLPITSILSDSVTIPISATPGSHRMRARMVWDATGFGASELEDYGCVNDYTVNISFPPCVKPANPPTMLTLTPSSNHISGSFAASIGTPGADHYLIVRSTLNSLTSIPVNGTIYNANDILGGGTVVAFQTGTTFMDTGLIFNTKYYYFIYALNSLNCTNGPLYLVTSLTGNTTTTFPLTKILNITAMLQAYYDFNTNNDLMLQTLDVDNDGNTFNKWPGLIVDTVNVQIRNTLYPNYAIEKEFPTSYINTDGTITLSGNLPFSFTGSHYIVVKHWKSIETWSDSVDFSNYNVNYNFYKNAPSTQFQGNMTKYIYNKHVNGYLIYAGDITDGNGFAGPQDGFVTLDDMFMVYDANLYVLSGYNLLDINGDGYVTLDDMFLVYDNNLVVAQVINPITINSK